MLNRLIMNGSKCLVFNTKTMLFSIVESNGVAIPVTYSDAVGIADELVLSPCPGKRRLISDCVDGEKRNDHIIYYLNNSVEYSNNIFNVTSL